MRAALLLLLLPALAGCLGSQGPPLLPPLGQAALRVESIAEGLEVPWAMAFAPDGRLFITERPGRVRVVEEGRLAPEPVATLPVAAFNEAGLMGLALDPDFASNQLLYVMYTHGAAGQPALVRISRFTLPGGADDEQVLLDGIQASLVHDGGRLKFGPDGKLWATTGDAANPALSQSDASLNGKVLRLNRDGGVPQDNPIPGSPAWTKGHRNPQGIAWDAQGRLFATEHGPSGNDGPGGRDELNLLERGRNYGWPQRYCAEQRAGAPAVVESRDPVGCWTPAIAPAGLAALDGTRYAGWGGSLFFGALRGAHLHRSVVDGQGQLAEDERLFEGTYGRIRDVAVGPDGLLYFSTSNRDGRGEVRQGDDHVYRIAPR